MMVTGGVNEFQKAWWEEGKIIYTIPRCCLQVHECLVIRRFQVFVVVVVVKPVNLILWSGYLSERPRITI